MPPRKKRSQGDDNSETVEVLGIAAETGADGSPAQHPQPASPRRSPRMASSHTSPGSGVTTQNDSSAAGVAATPVVPATLTPIRTAVEAEQVHARRTTSDQQVGSTPVQSVVMVADGINGRQMAADAPKKEREEGNQGSSTAPAPKNGEDPKQQLGESPEEKVQRLRHEDALLRKAKTIRKTRDTKLPSVWQAPKQGRLHWDALLEEVQWLAKEFQKERVWKIKQARRYAVTAQKSNMDVESRVIVRQKEEEKNLRKKAAWITKEVMTFWDKARRVVMYKIKTEVDAKKKEVMDKQLDFLLGQTQKYSSMLAERLVGEEATAAAAPGQSRQEQLKDEEEEAEEKAQQADHAGSPARPAQQQQASASRAGSAMGGAPADGDESGDYVSGQDDDADDEATLEEEERVTAEEAGGADVAAQQAAEVAGLADDADLPLEHLLARYGYVVPGEGEQVTEDASEAAGTEPGGETEEGVGSEGSDSGSEHGIDVLLEDPMMSAAQKAQRAIYPSAPSRLTVARQADVESDSEGDAGVSYSKEAAGSGSDEEGDYHSGRDDDADDEATLEEEERMAAEEGGGVDVATVHATEVAALADDADVPLEQLLPPELLAHYGFVTTQNDDTGEAAVAERPAAELSMPSRLAEELADVASDEDDEGAGGERSAEDDEGDYQSGQDDDADDEATLEEEEKLAAEEAAGADLAVVQAKEVAGLTDDADVPLDQLLPPEMLARYGFVTAQDEGEEMKDVTACPGAETGMVREAPEQHVQQQQEPVKQKVKEDIKVKPMQHGKPGVADVAEPSNVVTRPSNEVAQRSAEVDKDASDDEDSAPQGIEAAMAAMAGLQPLGSTLETAKVKTKPPFLLKGQLREYQHIGLDWLFTLYQKRLNGILADEMGLGKTIQTIALLAHLACEKGDWGPHLVVVPTSVMLNWEMEFKKWCPAFKLLTYFGGVKERAAKRQGWSKPNAFHVCITSYTLVLQDARMFKRKKWKYLILDEAHMIKNWKSQRWQTLLNFNSKRRLLITGTPLQNDLMELWSLMHFLMPQVFASHAQFKDWFSNPLTGMVEGSAEMNRAIVERLHAVLRPFLLRRLKKDVEKQLPQKHEHVIFCRLSKRQRQLYEEYMHNSDTRATLSSGNFLGIMNCLMQLRKVCNHPDLFEGRPIVSAFDMEPLRYAVPRAALYATSAGPFGEVDRRQLDLLPIENEELATWEAASIAHLALLQQAFAVPATAPQEDVQLLFRSAEELASGGSGCGGAGPGSLLQSLPFRPSPSSLQIVIAFIQAVTTRRRLWRRDRTLALGQLSIARTARRPLYGRDLVEALRVWQPVQQVHIVAQQRGRHLDYSSFLREAVKLPAQRAAEMDETLKAFCFVIPKARSAPVTVVCSRPDSSVVNAALRQMAALQQEYLQHNALLHTPSIRTQLFFPDRRLIQFDSGKLQELAALLRKLKAGGHKALIFTQMSKMLDILEVFLNLHGYTYLRLDGSTKPEERQILMQRFNTDSKLFVFILSTRSGGVGMNLTGADNVIFYDSDWNPAMDAQAQDRCHRIGQTREVHIWRLVSEHTIEENILKKSDQKRQLDWLAIQSGGFTTEAILSKFDPKAILGVSSEGVNGGKISEAEVAAAMRAAEDEGDVEAAVALEKETAEEMEEFTREPPPQAAEGDQEGDDSGAPTDDRGKTPEPSGVVATPPPAAAVTATAGGGGEDEIMADVVAMAGGASGSDAIAQLDHALRPVEKYAVRLLESTGPGVDRDALERQVEATYKVEELDIDQIEREEEEREADIDEDSEQNIVADWDEAAADEAYKSQVEMAQREEEERKAAEAAWLEEYNAMLAQSAPLDLSASLGLGGSLGVLRGKGGKGSKARAAGYESAETTASGGRSWRGRQGSPGLPAVRVKQEDEDYEPEGGEVHGWGIKRRRSALDSGRSPRAISSPRSVVGAAFPRPWELQEDFVLCCVASTQLEQGQQLGPAAWQAASDALGAGVAATTMAGVESAASQGRNRGPQACQQRYNQLAAAFRASSTNKSAELSSALLHTQALLLQWISGGGDAPPDFKPEQQQLLPDRDGTPSQQRQMALGAVQQLVFGGGLAAGGPLQVLLQRLLGGGLPEAEGQEGAVDVGSISQQEAEAILAAVKKLMGGGAARVITGRLPVVLEAGRQGGVDAGREALLASFSRPNEQPRVTSPRGVHSPQHQEQAQPHQQPVPHQLAHSSQAPQHLEWQPPQQPPRSNGTQAAIGAKSATLPPGQPYISNAASQQQRVGHPIGGQYSSWTVLPDQQYGPPYISCAQMLPQQQQRPQPPATRDTTGQYNQQQQQHAVPYVAAQDGDHRSPPPQQQQQRRPEQLGGVGAALATVGCTGPSPVRPMLPTAVPQLQGSGFSFGPTPALYGMPAASLPPGVTSAFMPNLHGTSNAMHLPGISSQQLPLLQQQHQQHQKLDAATLSSLCLPGVQPAMQYQQQLGQAQAQQQQQRPAEVTQGERQIPAIPQLGVRHHLAAQQASARPPAQGQSMGFPPGFFGGI